MTDINKAVLRGPAVINDGDDILPWTAETMEQAILYQRSRLPPDAHTDPRLPRMPEDVPQRNAFCAQRAAEQNRFLFGCRILIGEGINEA